MKRKTKTLIATVATAAIAIPGATAATAPSDFAMAGLETEQQNMAWYADLDTDAAQNESCREDLSEPVFQPEYDGRVIVKSEIVGAGAIACVDIQLESNAVITGRLWLEARTGPNVWETITSRPVSGSMIKGVGAAYGVIDHVFDADDDRADMPLRICIETDTPDESHPFCLLAKASSMPHISFTE